MTTLADLPYELKAMTIAFVARIPDADNIDANFKISDSTIRDICSFRQVSSAFYGTEEAAFAHVLSLKPVRLTAIEAAMLERLSGRHTAPHVRFLTFSDDQPDDSSPLPLVWTIRKMDRLEKVILHARQTRSGERRMKAEISAGRSKAASKLHVLIAAAGRSIHTLILPPLSVDAEPLLSSLPVLPGIVTLHLGLKDGAERSYVNSTAPWNVLPRHFNFSRYLKHFANITTLVLDIRGISRFTTLEFSTMVQIYAANPTGDRPRNLKRLEIIEHCWPDTNGLILLTFTHKDDLEHLALAQDQFFVRRDWPLLFATFAQYLQLDTLYLQDILHPAETAGMHPALFDFADRILISEVYEEAGETMQAEGELYFHGWTNDEVWVRERIEFAPDDERFWEPYEEGEGFDGGDSVDARDDSSSQSDDSSSQSNDTDWGRPSTDTEEGVESSDESDDEQKSGEEHESDDEQMNSDGRMDDRGWDQVGDFNEEDEQHWDTIEYSGEKLELGGWQ